MIKSELLMSVLSQSQTRVTSLPLSGVAFLCNSAELGTSTADRSEGMSWGLDA